MANGFVEHIQIDLTDFRNLPCTCNLIHKWVLDIIEHLSKFTWLYQLHSKENEEVLNILEKQFYRFGFPGIVHSDNG